LALALPAADRTQRVAVSDNAAATIAHGVRCNLAQHQSTIPR
jgi:hypothetical protein